MIKTMGTMTSEGFIPHASIPHLDLRCPVRLDFTNRSESNLYPPVRENGRLVYVLPGGVSSSDVGGSS